jgi:hypothetical protein
VDTGINLKQLPDKRWMLLCLSTLNKHHRIFQKGFVPITKVEKALNNLAIVPNPNDLYSDVPAAGQGKGGRGGLSQKQRLEFKLEAYKRHIEKQNKRKDALANRINNLNKEEDEKNKI